MNKYRIPNSDLINYVSFCESVEKQFYDIPSAKSNLADVKSKSLYSHQEETLLQSILNHLRREIRTRRILVKPSFQDFDRINVQHVTYEQFTRALTKLGLNIPDVCFKILARKYMDKNNTREINYEGFLKDVDYEHALSSKGVILPVDVQNPIPLPAPHTSFGVDQVYGDHTVAPVSRRPQAEADLTESQLKRQHDEHAIRFAKATDKDFRPAGVEVGADTKNKVPLSFSALGNSQLKVAGDIDALEDKIKAHVVMYKIRIEQFFIDFDKLRKGTVSKDQFRRILKLSGIDLQDYQYDLLVKKYSLDGTSNMDWFTFCKNIDKIFTTRGIEKNPLYVVPPIGSDSTTPARRHYLKLNEDEREKLLQVLTLIRQEIQTRRILFKKHFQDFDVVHNGFVSRSQFLRVLSLFEIYPQEELLNVLLKCYTDNSNLNEVNYYEFCKDVDGQDEVTQSINNTHASRFGQIPEAKTRDPYIYKDTNQGIDEVIARIQQKVKEERIRLREFLRDFDRLRSGNITNSQFRIGLNMAKLPLSNSDFTAITEHFKVPEKQGHMKWAEFCDVVDQVFNLKNLEMNPNATAQVQSLHNKSARELMGPFDLEIARKLIDRFKFFTQATRLYVKQFFQDWDRLGRNKVSPKQFRQVLATVKFNITDAEHRAITQYYLCSDGNLNYVEFIKDTTPESMAISNEPVEHTSQLAKTGLNSLAATSPAGFEFESQVVGQNSAPPVHGGSQQAPNYSYMPDLEVDPMKVLERIKRDVRINRTRLREYLQDFDGLRKGNMTVNKFFGSIDKLK